MSKTERRKMAIKFDGSADGLNCCSDRADVSAQRSSISLNVSYVSSSQEEAIRPASPMVSQPTSTPFKATMIWNQIVEELKVSVVVKKRRITRGRNEKCFTGADAVDIVYKYLTTHESQFDAKQVTRERATKLCQLLIDFQIAVSLRPADSKKFEDGHNNLYRFTSAEVDEGDGDSGKPMSPTSTASSDVNNHVSSTSEETDQFMECDVIGNRHLLHQKSKSTLVLRESPRYRLNYGPLWKRHSAECVHSVTQPPRPPSSPPTNWFYRRTSLPFCSNLGPDCNRPISPEELESEEREMIRESALSYLLLLIDLPVLDGIANYDPSLNKSRRRWSLGAGPAPSSVAFVNVAAVQQFNSVVSPFVDPGDEVKDESCDTSTSANRDTWWTLGLHCLDSLMSTSCGINSSISSALSDLISSTSPTQPIPDWSKLELFNLISILVGQPSIVVRSGLDGLRNGSGLDSAVWPDVFEPVHIELYRLVMGGCYSKAVRALRLSTALLDEETVDQLRRVLEFIRCASDEAQVRLSDTMSNRTAVERTFSTVLIRSRTLTPHQTGQLTMFMSDHCDVMWTLPDDVDSVIRTRLSSDGATSCSDNPLGVRYCEQITDMQYMEQRSSYTDKSLVELMNSILDDTTISLKVKKQHLKLFAKHHTRLYLKYFPNMI